MAFASSCLAAGPSLVRLGKSEVPRHFRQVVRRQSRIPPHHHGISLLRPSACQQQSSLSFRSRYFSSSPRPEADSNTSSCSDSFSKSSSESAMPSHQLSRQLGLATLGIGAAGLAFIGLSGYWDSDRVQPSSSSKVAQCQSTANVIGMDSTRSDTNSPIPTIDHDSAETSADHEEGEADRGNGAANFFVEQNANQFLQIFSGTSNPELAREIASHLKMPLGRIKIGRFADGEVTLEVLDEVRGKDVFVVQSAPSASSNSSPHSSLMELFFMVSAMKRASAKRVTAVLPYMSYFRQTTQTDQSKPLAAADMALILTTMGCDRVVFVDVHTRRAEGFFPPIPITNLQPQSLAIEYFRRKKEVGRSVVIVSTDNTGTERAEAFMSRMKQAGFETGMATLVSNRPERPQKEAGALVVDHQSSEIGVVCSGSPTKNESKKTEDWLVGDVGGKDCIIVDDIIDTGERAVNAAFALKSAGARRVFMYATHGLFSRGAIDRITKSPIREVVVTDTIRIPENLYCEKLRVISVSLLLAETIRRIHRKQPLSDLHRDSTFDQKITEDQNYQ